MNAKKPWCSLAPFFVVILLPMTAGTSALATTLSGVYGRQSPAITDAELDVFDVGPALDYYPEIATVFVIHPYIWVDGTDRLNDFIVDDPTQLPVAGTPLRAQQCRENLAAGYFEIVTDDESQLLMDMSSQYMYHLTRVGNCAYSSAISDPSLVYVNVHPANNYIAFIDIERIVYQQNGNEWLQGFGVDGVNVPFPARDSNGAFQELHFVSYEVLPGIGIELQLAGGVWGPDPVPFCFNCEVGWQILAPGVWVTGPDTLLLADPTMPSEQYAHLDQYHGVQYERAYARSNELKITIGDGVDADGVVQGFDCGEFEPPTIAQWTSIYWNPIGNQLRNRLNGEIALLFEDGGVERQCILDTDQVTTPSTHNKRSIRAVLIAPDPRVPDQLVILNPPVRTGEITVRLDLR